MGPFLSEQSFGDLVLEIVSDHIENNFIWPVASSPFFLHFTVAECWSGSVPLF